MSDLSLFFADAAAAELTDEVVISTRFKDKDGQPVKWKLRAITEEINAEIKKACTKKDKKGRVEFDNNEYLTKVAVEGTVFPNLKDAKLQQSYGVLGADSLLKKMLLAGEFSLLAEKVSDLSGFNLSLQEQVEEAKN
ncbi:phage tail assembly chaperone [Paenibacillus aquistagni]|uniref:Phage XkdN-like tail assembly chaperone protein, TAC n=1 Tax=Paenibacillus aquistagni TaxID=1852522 RepID=A0A1X7KCJ8_9BACL|nr:phage portal protein [Paenibacillus aquistagni]SMG38251.1 Phage XkdN-like tail assembly chaperone protein, TAC [Paenibacillus aquistagni]